MPQCFDRAPRAKPGAARNTSATPRVDTHFMNGTYLSEQRESTIWDVEPRQGSLPLTGRRISDAVAPAAHNGPEDKRAQRPHSCCNTEALPPDRAAHDRRRRRALVRRRLGRVMPWSPPERSPASWPSPRSPSWRTSSPASCQSSSAASDVRRGSACASAGLCSRRRARQTADCVAFRNWRSRHRSAGSSSEEPSRANWRIR